MPGRCASSNPPPTAEKKRPRALRGRCVIGCSYSTNASSNRRMQEELLLSQTVSTGIRPGDCRRRQLFLGKGGGEIKLSRAGPSPAATAAITSDIPSGSPVSSGRGDSRFAQSPIPCGFPGHAMQKRGRTGWYLPPRHGYNPKGKSARQPLCAVVARMEESPGPAEQDAG